MNKQPTNHSNRSFETILLSKESGAAWLTLNRPDALNATTPKMFSEISQALNEISADRDMKALVITGAGKAFCIGSDINFLKAYFESDNLELFRDYLERINKVLFAIEELPIPTIGMVNGKARAGGFELLMACDLIVIAREAKIGDVHTPFGHMPGAGATQRASRKIGMQKALELIYTGKWLSGVEAVEYGLALKAVPLAELTSETQRLVAQLTDKTRDSLTYIKRAVLRGWDLPLRDGIALEVQSYLEYLATSKEPTNIFRANQEKRGTQK